MLKLPFSFRKLLLALSGGVCAFSAGLFLYSLSEETNAANSRIVSAPVESAIDVRFVNVQTWEEGTGHPGGAATLFRTKDNKYVLLDTGDADSRTITRIKDILSDWQNSPDTLTLDFLIVSHLDTDHYGNAEALISDSKIKVKNVVIKQESVIMSVSQTVTQVFNSIVSATMSENANLYTNATSYAVDGIGIKDYSKYKKLNAEGTGNAKISLGKNLTMYFFNTADVYAGKPCVGGSFAFWTHDSSDPWILKDSNGRARMFDNSTGAYPNTPLTATSNLKTVDNGNFNKIWYLKDLTEGGTKSAYSNTCLSNGNSYAVLFEVTTDVKPKYIYIPSDIENVGFDMLPKSTQVTYYDVLKGKKVTKTLDVYGNSMTTIYPGVTADNVFNGYTIPEQNYIPSETIAALEVASLLGDNLNDIAIFQLSHHGLNNAPDAIATLNLNRDDVWGINSRRADLKDSDYIPSTRMYHYTLSEVTGSNHYRYTGRTAYDYQGVSCQINSAGSTFCAYRGANTRNLLYDSNGGAEALPATFCMSTDSSTCNVKVTTEQPTRDGYAFIGWSESATSTTADIKPTTKIALSEDITLYAIWEKIPSSPALSDLITNTTTATIAVSSSDTFVVTSSTPCIALLSTDGGTTFSRLSPSLVSSQPNTYSFTVPDPSTASSIVIHYTADVNIDNSVNVRDARAIINSILGTETLSSAQSLLADVNADNSVNVRDARAIINSILGNASLTW